VGGRAIYAAAVAFFAIVAAALIGAAPAYAANHTVVLDQTGPRFGSPVVIAAGDVVAFTGGQAAQPALAPGFYVVLHSTAGLFPDQKLKSGQVYSLAFPSAGAWTFTWSSYYGPNLPLRGSPSVTVQAVDTSPGSPTPTGSGGGGGSSSVPPGGPSSGGGGGSLPVGLTGAPGLPGGASGTAAGGATFSFGPHPDTGSPARASSAARSSAASSSSSSAPVPYVTTSVVPAQQVAKAAHASPPALLAVLAIIVFAGVGAGYAYQHFGPHAGRSTNS
jgi:hypothetical protein